jgi:uncharacterized membrane protein YjgN (DUF898 family)
MLSNKTSHFEKSGLNFFSLALVWPNLVMPSYITLHLEKGLPMFEQNSSSIPGGPTVKETYKASFDGNWIDLALLMLKNVVLTIFTLGIYSFWGRTRSRKFLWSHMMFAGDRFEYTGTGSELLMGWLKAIGVYAGGTILIGLAAMAHPTLGTVMTFIFGLAMICLVPFAIYLSRNYRLTRTKWRGVRFSMTDQVGGFVSVFGKGYLFAFLTLGLYTPWFQNNIYSYLTNNTRFGSEKFSYTGKAKDLIPDYILLLILTPLTLGIYIPWFMASLMRYRAEHTRLGDAQKVVNITGGDLLFLGFINLVIVLITLGLGTPWVICRSVDLIASRTSFHGHIDFARIQQIAANGGAFGDVMGEALDVDLGF